MTSTEIKELLDKVKAAYIRSIESGGMVQYTVNSGQGQTQVRQATSSELLAQMEKLQIKYDAALDEEDGSNLMYIRD